MKDGIGTKANPIDFDHESAAHAQDWPNEFARMRSQCPVAWTGQHGGFWVATSYDAVVGMARQTETFSSEKQFDPSTGAGRGGITIPFTPIPRGLPVVFQRWGDGRLYLQAGGRSTPRAESSEGSEGLPLETVTE